MMKYLLEVAGMRSMSFPEDSLEKARLLLPPSPPPPLTLDYLISVNTLLKPHCIRCSHFKVIDDVSALEASSKPPVRIVEDNGAAPQHWQRTPMP
jgi:hypothetical protein